MVAGFMGGFIVNKFGVPQNTLVPLFLLIYDLENSIELVGQKTLHGNFHVNVFAPLIISSFPNGLLRMATIFAWCWHCKRSTRGFGRPFADQNYVHSTCVLGPKPRHLRTNQARYTTCTRTIMVECHIVTSTAPAHNSTFRPSCENIFYWIFVIFSSSN